MPLLALFLEASVTSSPASSKDSSLLSLDNLPRRSLCNSEQIGRIKFLVDHYTLPPLTLPKSQACCQSLHNLSLCP